MDQTTTAATTEPPAPAAIPPKPRTQKQVWAEEFKNLEQTQRQLEGYEVQAKKRLKEAEQELKAAKRSLARINRDKKAARKKVQNFWKGKSSKMYRDRKWASRNVGEVMSKVIVGQ